MIGPITIIQEAVAEEFGITRDELLSKNREPRFAHPRIIAMALARELTRASFPRIARKFGRHHSTVLHAVERSHNLIDQSPEYLDRRDAILRKLQPSSARSS